MDFGGLWPLLLVLILVIVGAVVNRRFRLRALNTYSLSDDRANAISVELLDYVKRKSYNPGDEVALDPFWKGCGLTDGDKALVLQPLFDTEVLLVMVRTGQPILEQAIEKFTEWASVPLRSKVVLNPQEYRRMTNGGNVTHIHGDQFNEWNDIRNQIRQDGSGTMNIGAVQAGDHPEARDSYATSTQHQGLTAADMLAIANALQADAATLDERQAATVAGLAEEIKTAGQANQRDRFGDLFKRTMEYVNLMGNTLEQTTRIVDAIQQ